MSNILIKKEDINLQPNSITTKVVVYSDRAEVTRIQKVKLTQGENSTAFTNLGMGIVKNSIRVSLKSDNAKIISSSLEENYLYFFKEKENEEKRNGIIQTLKDIISIINEKSVIGVENYILEDLQEYVKVALNDIILEQSVPISQLSAGLEFIEEKINNNSEELVEINEKQRQLEEKLTILKEQLQKTESFDKKQQNNIIIKIIAQEECEMQITVTYIVPNVRWEASYDFSLNTEDNTITMAYYGEITQHTGENWENVMVTLSSSVIEANIEIPKLYPVYLSGYEVKRSKELNIESEELEDGFFPEGVEEEAPKESEEEEKDLRVKVDKKGASSVFNIEKPYDIPSDGNGHKLLILSSNFIPKLNYETIPELMEYVYFKATIKNNTTLPLLPGKIFIYRNKSYMGKSSLKYIAQNENFDLSFGIDEDLRIKRVVFTDKNRTKQGITMKNTKELDIHFNLDSYKNEQTSVIVKEAIYKSKLKEVSVKILDDTTEKYNLDENNIISWEIKLNQANKKTKDIILHYQITSQKNFDITNI